MIPRTFVKICQVLLIFQTKFPHKNQSSILAINLSNTTWEIYKALNCGHNTLENVQKYSVFLPLQSRNTFMVSLKNFHPPCKIWLTFKVISSPGGYNFLCQKGVHWISRVGRLKSHGSRATFHRDAATTLEDIERHSHHNRNIIFHGNRLSHAYRV